MSSFSARCINCYKFWWH